MEKTSAKYNKGINKEIQEDVAFVENVNDSESPIQSVLMVADGWGTKTGEEPIAKKVEAIVKQLFVSGSCKQLSEKNRIASGNISDVLTKSFSFIEEQLNNLPSNYLEEKGTTCTIALILKSPDEYTNVVIGHVGNCRAYIVSPNNIRLVTQDDSLVWQYYLQERIKYSDIVKNVDRHFLTQALGCKTFTEPQIIQAQIKKDEVLLLSSDGLYEIVSEKRIKRIVNSIIEPQKICEKLLDGVTNKKSFDYASIAIYSKRENVKSRHVIFIFTVLVILISIIFFFGTTLTNYFNGLFYVPNKHVSKIGTTKKAELKVQEVPPKIVEDTLNEITAEDFEVRIPSIISYDNRNNVDIRVAYKGDQKDKYFNLKISGAKIKGITNSKFLQKILMVLRFPNPGRYSYDVVITDEKSKEIYNKRFVSYVQEKMVTKPTFKLSMLTLKITNYESVKNSIEAINWMEGANDKYQPASDKHIYKSSKVIPAKIKVRFKNGTVADFPL